MKKHSLSRNIAFLMDEHNITSETQLAKLCGMPQTTINKLITGFTSDPRISTLMPIAAYFKISVGELLSESPINNKIQNHELKTQLIPVIAYDELNDIYNDLQTLNTAKWPDWYPIPQQASNNHYAVLSQHNQLPKPFERAKIIIIENLPEPQNNQYCIIKHISSDSINIKKIMFDSGKTWLLSLQPELPTIEFTEYEYLSFGSILATVTEISSGHFISMEGAE